MLSITSGGFELLESRNFLVMAKDATKLTLGEGDEQLTIIFEFAESDSQEPVINWRTVDEKTLIGTLVNWSSHMGIVTSELVEIGTYRDKALYLALNVRAVGSKDLFREVLASFYLGEPV